MGLCSYLRIYETYSISSNLPTSNSQCYSYRIHALLLRACVEVEAKFRAILQENGYKKNQMTMDDCRKINVTHRLSSYEVKIPTWTGDRWPRAPFEGWSTGHGLPWYQAYNAAKHDRQKAFQSATFDHLIDATCGLLVILSAQFETNDFSLGNSALILGDGGDGFEAGIGEFFSR